MQWKPNRSKPLIAGIPLKRPSQEQVNKAYMLFYSMIGGFASVVQTQITDVYNYARQDKKLFRMEAKKRLTEAKRCSDELVESFMFYMGKIGMQQIWLDLTDAIEERLGGKLNLETLEIEKQPEFKDGDILFTKTNMLHFSSVFILDTNRNEMRSYARFLIERGHIDYGMPVYNLDTNRFRYATEEEKQQLFEALAKKGKAWDAEKKAIVDLKPKCEFKPFDRCIWKIRNCEGSIWQASFVSYVDEYGATPMGMSIDEDLVNLIILPYNEETAKLIGTTKDVEK